VLAGVEKPAAERRVTLRFADGRALVAELVPHRANLLLLEPSGEILAAARRGRRASSLAPGEPFRPVPLPPGRIDPFRAGADEIRARIEADREASIRPQTVLTRGFVGIGRSASELLAEEAGRDGRDLAEVVVERLSGLVAGAWDPVIETDAEPLEAAAEGRLDPGRCRLLPWRPPWPAVGSLRRLARDDASATAGLYHDAVERFDSERRRTESLVAVLDREARRLREVEIKVAADFESFENPERYRRWGEALLAGLKTARRVGDHVLVPDPYDVRQAPIPVPVPPGQSPTRAADALFARHRRARRGRDRARQRAREVAERRERLERLRERHAGPTEPGSAGALEQAMQREGIPVGLEPVRRGARTGARPYPARLEGVRLFLSRDGDAVLIGKSGKDNHRLTFKLASPEDFWLHALGVPGAHVIVRNERRKPRPSPSTLSEAAEAAAWFSEAREQPRVDVQWTRRKYVRRLRGAPPGTVTVKRSETVRVQPRCPVALAGRR
jgi:predicted ribosome quality control (RQC) complex YloA/Tae2 family protein